MLAKAREAGRAALTADEAKAVCDAYGIATPGEGIAESADLAGDIADDLGYPVVMKIVSPDILHKTDVGGVITNIADRQAAIAAYDVITAAAKHYNANATITGVQVQQQLDAAQEVIVGAATDPSFGKLVAFGLGGVLVEVLRDVTFRLAPTTEQHAKAMLNEITGAEILDGVRGQEGVNRSSVGRTDRQRERAGGRLPGDRGTGSQPSIRHRPPAPPPWMCACCWISTPRRRATGRATKTSLPP